MHVRGRLTRLLALTAALAGGCMNGPFNGTVYDGDGGVVGVQKVGFNGYYPQPNYQIRVQVLNSPNADPSQPGNWTELPGSPVYTGTQAYYYNDPSSPMYAWQLTTTPGSKSGAWTAGGLARVRAQAVTQSGAAVTVTYELTAFDDDFDTCRQQFANQSWETIKNNCRTLYSPDSNVATLVSSYKKPSATQATASTSPYLTLPAGAGHDDNVGKSYYHNTLADVLYSSLSAFKLQLGFGLGSASETSAVYYNAGDLGLGREMHCISGTGIKAACYVTNYADRVPPGNDPQKRIFGGSQANVNDALANAVKGAQGLPGSDPVATVAMIDFGGGKPILFLVFDAAGNLSPRAVLDGTTHPNTQVPSNCMTCHAGNGSFDGTSVTNAHFLPFDLDSFQYSPAAGFSETDQLDKFRQLNAIVQGSTQTTAGAALLKGWYPPNGPQTSAATFNGDWVPDAWNYLPASRVYRAGIKKYCRTCHVSQFATDFSTPTQLTNLENAGNGVTKYLCDSHQMPQALVTQNNFWNSSARAHLLGFLGANRDCAP